MARAHVYALCVCVCVCIESWSEERVTHDIGRWRHRTEGSPPEHFGEFNVQTTYLNAHKQQMCRRQTTISNKQWALRRDIYDKQQLVAGPTSSLDIGKCLSFFPKCTRHRQHRPLSHYLQVCRAHWHLRIFCTFQTNSTTVKTQWKQQQQQKNTSHSATDEVEIKKKKNITRSGRRRRRRANKNKVLITYIAKTKNAVLPFFFFVFFFSSIALYTIEQSRNAAALIKITTTTKSRMKKEQEQKLNCIFVWHARARAIAATKTSAEGNAKSIPLAKRKERRRQRRHHNDTTTPMDKRNSLCSAKQRAIARNAKYRKKKTPRECV